MLVIGLHGMLIDAGRLRSAGRRGRTWPLGPIDSEARTEAWGRRVERCSASALTGRSALVGILSESRESTATARLPPCITTGLVECSGLRGRSQQRGPSPIAPFLLAYTRAVKSGLMRASSSSRPRRTRREACSCPQTRLVPDACFCMFSV